MDDPENAIIAKMEAAAASQRQETATERKSHEEIAGDYVDLENGFWARAMKLRQQRQMVREFKARQTDDEEETGFNFLIVLLTQLLYKTEGSGFRPANEDEILDAFDADEGRAVVKRFTGIALGEDAKNA
jgi:hypothetical protein